jgi:hypothetical protein
MQRKKVFQHVSRVGKKNCDKNRQSGRRKKQRHTAGVLKTDFLLRNVRSLTTMSRVTAASAASAASVGAALDYKPFRENKPKPHLFCVFSLFQ